jgi:hypothetical protein
VKQNIFHDVGCNFPTFLWFISSLGQDHTISSIELFSYNKQPIVRCERWKLFLLARGHTQLKKNNSAFLTILWAGKSLVWVGKSVFFIDGKMLWGQVGVFCGRSIVWAGRIVVWVERSVVWVGRIVV